MIGVCSLLIVPSAVHNWSMSYPIGPPAGGTPASYCSRDRVNPLRLGTILIVTGALAPGILLVPVGGAAAPSLGSILFRFKRARALIGVLLFPSPDGTVARWHPYSPESLGIPRVSASSCSHRVPDWDHAIIHMPRGRGFSHPWDLFSSSSGGRTPQLGHLFFQL